MHGRSAIGIATREKKVRNYSVGQSGIPAIKKERLYRKENGIKKERRTVSIRQRGASTAVSTVTNEKLLPL